MKRDGYFTSNMDLGFVKNGHFPSIPRIGKVRHLRSMGFDEQQIHTNGLNSGDVY